jgi:hypothetical protein
MSSYNPSEIFTVHKTDFIQDFWFKSNHKFIEEIITLIDYQNKEKEIDFLINKIIN